MYGLGDEARQGLQGGAQRIQAAFQGSQAGLQVLVLGVQLGHEVVHGILGLRATEVGEKRLSETDTHTHTHTDTCNCEDTPQPCRCSAGSQEMVGEQMRDRQVK